MDDFLKSVISEIQVITCQVTKRIGFNLTKFKSNSNRVLKVLPDSKYEKTTQDLARN